MISHVSCAVRLALTSLAWTFDYDLAHLVIANDENAEKDNSDGSLKGRSVISNV